MSDTHSLSTRTVDGVELPAAGTFVLDGAYPHVGFSVRPMMVAKVRGQFGSVNGTAVVADDPYESSVVADIDVASSRHP